MTLPLVYGSLILLSTGTVLLLQNILHMRRQAKRLGQSTPVKRIQPSHGQPQYGKRLALVPQRLAPVLKHEFRSRHVFGCRSLHQEQREKVGDYCEAYSGPCEATPKKQVG